MNQGILHPRRRARIAAWAVSVIAILLVAGCGGGGEERKGGPGRGVDNVSSAQLREQLRQATASTAAEFPAVGGRSLQQMADSLAGKGPEVGLATSIFTPGENRLGFGVIDAKTGFVYAKTAVYVAPTPKAEAQGPYPAPADLLITDPAYRSQTAASEKDPFAAIYEARVPFEKTGQQSVLVVSKLNGRLVGAAAQVKVVPEADDPVVGVGERAPAVQTDTVQSAGGDVKAIDTRIPADDMHDVALTDVLGKKPVALVFATPQLCQSRVCGPVVDIAAQLKAKYGMSMQFIHQEVYVDNKVEKGLRPSLKGFGLQTEPWLFVIGRDGKVAARLEGSFGLNAFERAIQKGLSP